MNQKTSTIYVLTGGWVLVGTPHESTEDDIKLENAKVIRVWGTSKGLGQLRNGPTKETKLDPIKETVYITKGQIIFQFNVTGF
jgi:hypothetical protein